jgi:hypothetical protein
MEGCLMLPNLQLNNSQLIQIPFTYLMADKKWTKLRQYLNFNWPPYLYDLS